MQLLEGLHDHTSMVTVCCAQHCCLLQYLRAWP
jgi:hypothetical protein